MAGGGGRTGPGGQRFSRHSFGYQDGDDHVHETAIVHANYELVLIERMRLDGAMHTLHVAIALTGPDGRSAQLQGAFEVPPTVS